MKYIEFSWRHMKDLERLADESFKFTQSMDNEKDAIYICRAFLLSYIKEMDFSRIAVSDEGEVKGFILGKLEKDSYSFFKIWSSVWFYFLIVILSFKQFISKSLRDTIKDFQKIDIAYKKLVKCQDCQGQILLFIVGKNSQRQGIGYNMMKLLFEYMKQNNVENIYLYTDDFCSYQFYDQNGFIKNDTQFVKLQNDTTLEIYLYQKNIGEE